MLIDDVTIRVHAGNGGNGKVAFNSNMKSLGPTGATGGNGGSVYFEGVSDLGALYQFRNQKSWNAEPGEHGKTQFNDGKDGEDLVLRVPVGTVIHNLDKKTDEEIISVGQRILLAKGGKGGKGNFHFRSSTNTSPKEFEHGTAGEQYHLRLELKMIADVGFIGLPNVGKSSLLNELTNAKSKVANYQFTTLEPHLGAYYGLILADIPGLIEGASSGKGLGIKFLRHIERTKVIFHCIAADSEDPEADYQTVRTELGNFNAALLEKPEYILITKSDLGMTKTFNRKHILVSIHDLDSLKAVEKILQKLTPVV